MSERPARRAGSLVVSVATAVTLLAAALAPFLNPPWVAFAQGRAEATAWTGFTQPELRQATDRVLADLVTGGDFLIPTSSGDPLLGAREIAHMQDVQRVFAIFAAIAVAAVVALVVMRRIGTEQWWAAVRRGAVGLAGAIVAAGVVALFAFEFAFDLFHRLFFAGGTYTFDPRTDRLVQLFPLRFWFETSIAVGAVAIVLAALVTLLATRRLHAAHALPAPLAPRLETAR